MNYTDYTNQGKIEHVGLGEGRDEVIYYNPIDGRPWGNPENAHLVRPTSVIERCHELTIDPRWVDGELKLPEIIPLGRGRGSFEGWTPRDKMGSAPFEAPHGVMLQFWWHGRHHHKTLPAGRYQIVGSCIVAV